MEQCARAKFGALISVPLAVLFSVVPLSAQQAGPSPVAATTPSALVFDRITVVDVADGRLLPEQTVVVVGTRVQTVGPVGKVRAPKGAHVVDARGKYLVPGLWDMHVHIREYPQIFFPLLIATGVTGIREMGQHLALDSMLQWRREITAGGRVGPRLVVTGNVIRTTADSIAIATGRIHQPGRWLAISVATADDARRVVDSLKAAGADLVKLHSHHMPRDVYFAILNEARRVGIPVVGHVPGKVTALEASDSGQRSIEHANLFATPCRQATLEGVAAVRMQLAKQESNSVMKTELARSIAADSTAEWRCMAHIARLVRNETWFTPTLAVFAGWLTDTSENLRFWPDTVRADNLRSVLGERRVKKLLKDGQQLVGVTHQFSIPLLAGTDVAPGATTSMIHQELALFVEAGLTPAEALRTATFNPAKFLGATDSLGTVAPGKLADLILLDADPLMDIHNTTKIYAVVANGRYFDRSALDGMLAGLERDGKRTP